MKAAAADAQPKIPRGRLHTSQRLQAQALQPMQPLWAQATRPKGAQRGRHAPEEAVDCRLGPRPSEVRQAALWKPKAEAALEVDKHRLQKSCKKCASPAMADPSVSELRLATDQTHSMTRGTPHQVHTRAHQRQGSRAWPGPTPWN